MKLTRHDKALMIGLFTVAIPELMRPGDKKAAKKLLGLMPRAVEVAEAELGLQIEPDMNEVTDLFERVLNAEEVENG